MLLLRLFFAGVVGHDTSSDSSLRVAENAIFKQAGGDAPEIEGSRTTIQDGVGMVDVRARKIRDGGLESREAYDDL